MSEAAIKQAALEATDGRIYRSDGDFWADGPINLSKFVRFLARQPYIIHDQEDLDGMTIDEIADAVGSGVRKSES